MVYLRLGIGLCLLGIKKAVSEEKTIRLTPRKPMVAVKDVLDDLPALKSGLSREKKTNNTFDRWAETLRQIID